MPGEPTYLELGVGDADTARAFYGGLFGWTASRESGPGPVQTSSLAIGIHDCDPASHFEVFFRVDDLDVSLSKVVELGGEAMSDVQDNTDFGRWVECADNQGVRFGLREIKPAT